MRRRRWPQRQNKPGSCTRTAPSLSSHSGALPRGRSIHGTGRMYLWGGPLTLALTKELPFSEHGGAWGPWFSTSWGSGKVQYIPYQL